VRTAMKNTGGYVEDGVFTFKGMPGAPLGG
jgi:hypothetical protein